MSCLVARELDRFIFEDELVKNGAYLHQGPVRKKTGAHGNPEASDAYTLSFSNNYYPSIPALVSDMKLNDFEHAVKETGLYAQAGTVTCAHARKCVRVSRAIAPQLCVIS